MGDTGISLFYGKGVFMNLFQKWMNISLVLRIFIGLIIGAILGFIVPSQQ
jgi:Na+/serine symporter